MENGGRDPELEEIDLANMKMDRQSRTARRKSILLNVMPRSPLPTRGPLPPKPAMVLDDFLLPGRRLEPSTSRDCN